jgi:hypothetical protein
LGESLRLALAGVLVSLLAACSPYSYSKEIAAISTNVNKLSDAYTASFDAITADRAAELQAEAISRRSRKKPTEIKIGGPCEDEGVPKDGDAAPCALYIQGQPEPQWTAAERQRKPALEALQALKDYAEALAAVTNAQDRAAYDAAVGRLSGAVGTILSPLDAAAPGSSAVVSAGINVFGWLVGTALDEQRYDTLKKTVALVGRPLKEERSDEQKKADAKAHLACHKPDPVADKAYPRSAIRIVTDALCNGLQAMASTQRDSLTKKVDVLLDGLNTGKWSDNAYAKALADAQATLAAQDALRRANPGSAANGLADAHDKLVKAIDDPKANYTSFMKAVGEFADKVSALEAAVKAMTPAKKGS